MGIKELYTKLNARIMAQGYPELKVERFLKILTVLEIKGNIINNAGEFCEKVADS